MSEAPESQQPPHERGSARFFGRRRTLQTPAEALHPEQVPPPPGPRNSERRPMLSALSGFFSLALVASIVVLAAASFANRQLRQPGPLPADKVIFIAPGTDVVQIIDTLAKEKVIDQPTLLKTALWTKGNWSKVKAGEYLFKAHISHNQVIDTLVSGKQLLHSVTIPEGLTSLQIVERLRASEVLGGEIKEVPPEGSLLPETYKVTRGNSRSRLIRIMQSAQDRVLERVWKRRAANIILKSKYELLTLASIIEKETGRADERSRVAAVFYNRLKKRMRLQSDPTIVYGLVGGKGTLGRPIQRDEVRKASPYNTYVIPGLPPGPIANPGRAALEAAANPSQTNDLYFVANGTGGHTFAETLADHNRNVARWRQIELERKAATGGAAQTPDGSAPVDALPAEDRLVPEVGNEPPSRTRRGRRGTLIDSSPFGALRASVVRPVSGTAHAAVVKKSQADLTQALLRSRKGLQVMTQSPASQARPPKMTAPAQKAIATALKPKLDAKHEVRSQDDTAAPGKALAFAPAAAARMPQATGSPAFAPIRQADKPAAGPFSIGPDLEDLKLKIVGVTPDVTDSPLDGPLTDDEESGQGIDPSMIASVPMPPQKRAELEARAARYAGANPVYGGSTTVAPQTVTASSGPANGLQSAGDANQARTNTRRRIVDASAGTNLDPLKAKGWDLNSTHTIPGMR